jgi:hypothetical protein
LTGLFSIEGNLTADDAYFSGKAADHDEPISFKRAFLDEIWAMATSQLILRRYHAAATMADAQAVSSCAEFSARRFRQQRVFTQPGSRTDFGDHLCDFWLSPE